MSAPAVATPGGIPPSLASLLEGFTKLSKMISSVLIGGYVLQLLFPGVRFYLGLVPGKVLPQIWQVFTCGYLEMSFFGCLVDVIILLFTAKQIEPVWGSQEFLKFVVVVNSTVGFGVFLLSFFAYMFTRSEEILYSTLGGFGGVIAGFIVAVKQLIPEQELTMFGVFKFRAKHLPAFFVVMSGCLAVMGGGLDQLSFTLLGTYNAWYYLRFWQQKPDSMLRGDPSEQFSFASFFPEHVQPAVNNFSVKVTGYMAQGIRPGGAGGGANVVGGAPLPGSDAVEATRRRERGAKALEERLGNPKDAAPTAAAAGGEESGGDVEKGDGKDAKATE